MYQPKMRNEQTDLLVQTLLTLRDEETCYRLLEDLCTIHEVQSLAQRLEVARLLREKITYHEIAERTGASTATISRVNRCLTYGAEGYARVLDALEQP
jgi:TrpR-related protein YerC/YecD